MRRLAPRLLACALFGAGAAQATPFTVDQLLAQQRLGAVSIDPSQRWLVVPTTGPYRSATSWALEFDTPMTITRLSVVDLRADGPPRSLLAEADGGSGDGLGAYGYTPGPFSPSGARMAVIRARGASLEVGIVTLATGAVVWTGLFPTSDVWGRSMQWAGEDRLILLAKDADAPAMGALTGALTQGRLIEKWRRTREGRTGVTLLGAGRYLDRTPSAPPGRLVAVDAASGQGRVLAQGSFIDLEVAPGGRRAAVLAEAETLHPDPSSPAYTTDPYRRRRVVVVDLASGATWAPCPTCEVATDLLAWSPSGLQLLVYAKPDTARWTAARYWRLDAAARRAEPLEDPAAKTSAETTRYGSRVPRADWMGEDPLILAQAQDAPTGQTDWLRWTADGPRPLTRGLPPGPRALEATAANAIVVSLAGKLWRIDGQGRAKLLGTGASVPGPGAAGGERLAFNNRPAVDALTLALPAPDGQDLGQVRDHRLRRLGLTTAPGESVLAAAGRAGAVASLGRDPHGVERVVLRRRDRPPQILVTLNPQLAAVDFARPRAIAHKGPRGQALTSWLYLPPGLPAGRKAPLVTIPYLGRDYPGPPASQSAPARQVFLNAQILAGAGYAVLLPSLPIDPDREPSEGLADQILNVVDAAAAQEPAIDASRLALMGHSYGGYTVLAAATQSPRFKAVVASAFSADLIGHYTRKSLSATVLPEAGVTLMGDAGWAELGQGRMGAPPWRDPQRYVRNSPVLAADKITAPVMLIMGDLDGDPAQALTMFGALFRQDKDAMLLTYHGEGHVVLTPGNIADEYRRVLDFLKAQVGDEVIAPPVGAAPARPS